MDGIQVGDLVVHAGTVSHPLLGRAHVIEHAGVPVTAMSEIDWERPTQIPTIAEPRKLPAGTGSLLINDIAERAQRAGVQTLRYAGPYPTHALFGSLLRSFRTTATVAAFTADVLDRAVRLARDEVPIDFTPAPFTRRMTAHGFVDLRDGAVNRARIDGVLYDDERTPGSIARLRSHDRAWLAELSVELPVASIAVLDSEGDIVDGPRPIPAFPASINGTLFPSALCEQLADAATEFVAPPLAADVANAIRTRPVVWNDLGWRSAARHDSGFAVHVALLALRQHHMMLFAEQLSYHLAMIAQTTVLDELLAPPR